MQGKQSVLTVRASMQWTISRASEWAGPAWQSQQAEPAVGRASMTGPACRPAACKVYKTGPESSASMQAGSMQGPAGRASMLGTVRRGQLLVGTMASLSGSGSSDGSVGWTTVADAAWMGSLWGVPLETKELDRRDSASDPVPCTSPCTAQLFGVAAPPKPKPAPVAKPTGAALPGELPVQCQRQGKQGMGGRVREMGGRLRDVRRIEVITGWE